MSEFKGTREEVFIKINNEVGLLIGSEHCAVCTLWNHETEEIKLANANLIVDAFKVRQQINFELSDLLEHNKEMLWILKGLVSDVDTLLSDEGIEWQQAGYLETARELIAKNTKL